MSWDNLGVQPLKFVAVIDVEVELWADVEHAHLEPIL